MASRTVYTVLEETALAQGNAAALHQPNSAKAGGKYRVYTWLEYHQAVREIAAGLREIGLKKGDIAALFSETRAEFYLADIGVMSSGAIAAALYTSYPLPDLIVNLKTIAPKVIFVENPKSMSALLEAARGEGTGMPALGPWILLTGQCEGALTLEQLSEKGREALEKDPELFSRIREEITAQDPAILYLTSGATGEPKMGMVTHAALVSNIDMAPTVLPIGPDDSTIVFLPSAHIAQRVVLELVPLRMGTPVWFSESLAKLPHELKAIRPTFFLAPPRVWERVYATVCTEVKKRPAYARKVFYGALGMGAAASRLRQQGKPVPPWLSVALRAADRIVFRKVRERLGGRMRIAASGAAPLSKDLAEFFAAIGLPLVEGYGLTEGGVLALNPIDRPKPGSIGKLLPGVEMRLAEDGELLIKSPTLFSGYYRDLEATSSVLREGWLSTGDIAAVDDEGYLYITGRKKELIVSPNGKKIYPTRIESLFKVEPLINQVLLIGDQLPYITALFTINISNAETLSGMEPYHGRPPQEISVAPPVVREVQKAVSRANKQLADFEQIRKFRVLERDFTLENGELTPTMKIRRSRVLENHRSLVAALYKGKEAFSTSSGV